MTDLTAMTIPELIGAFEREFPDLGWLMRNDKSGECLVHLHSHDIGILPKGTALTFPVRADTPEAAFAEAFARCREYHSSKETLQ